MLFNSSIDLIGNTPMLYLDKLSKMVNSNIYLKLEKYNLNYSVKDRAVKQMIIDALNKNIINKDSTIIEATSGNTGISLASICASLSLKCVIVMPSDSNEERVKLIRFYNGKIIFTPKEEKMQGSINKAIKLQKEIKNSYILSQFTNINNTLSHVNTAKEIIDEVKDIDAFVSCFGTAGTITGIAKSLKEHNEKINICCVLPDSLNHKIPGIYSNNKQTLLNKEFIDKFIKIDDIDAYIMVSYIANLQGIGVGLSSSLAIAGALKLIRKHKYKNVVILCPDSIDRYLSNQNIFVDYTNKDEIHKDINGIYNNLFITQNFTDDLFYKYKINKKTSKKLYNDLIKDASFMHQNDPSSESVEQIISSSNCFFAIFIYRLSNYFYNHVDELLAKITSQYGHSITGIDINPCAKIDVPFSIDHGSGVVIGETAIIGKNVRLYQNVTLGALSLNNPDLLRNKKRHPTIKNNVIIYEKSSVLGGNTIIGNNVIIGSNITITSSINDNKIVTNQKNNMIIKENTNEL